MDKAVSILLVDDDPDDKFLFMEALEKVNMLSECNYRSNGDEALMWLTTVTELPDYIFLDLNMPRIDGLEVLQEIKKHGRLKSIPVIIYSTSSNQSDKEKAMRHGASLYITKPSRLADLKNAITSVFETIKATGNTKR
jgi:CheY-like chemotaxis protein